MDHELTKNENLSTNGNVKSSKDKKSTIIDIAEKTGYSIATVSRALNNFSNVKEDTKQRIMAISRELNYVPNVAAKNLVKGKSKIVGLVLPDRSMIYNDLVNFLYKGLLKHGYNLLVYNSNNEVSKQSFNVEQLIMQQVEAMIFLPIPGEYRVIDRIQSLNVPHVVANRFIPHSDSDHILFDFRKGMMEAVDTLANRGRKNFYQFARKDIITKVERRKIFDFALKVNGFQSHEHQTLEVDDSFESGYDRMREIIESGDYEVDTVFCSSDYTAFGAIRAALDLDLRIPEDISIIGCYDSSIAGYSNPRISTIYTDFKRMCDLIIERIMLRLGDEDVDIKNQSISTTFLERKTT